MLIESLLFEKGSGYFLLERHLDRLARSAHYFGFQFELESVRTSLEKCSQAISENSKVRLLLSKDGSVAIEVDPLGSSTSCPTSWITFAGQSVDSANRFLYHKTSNREMYRLELEKKPDCADVIFLNERGEVTEGANNNIVIRKDGILLTPPVACGLLPGTLRAQLLETGEVTEGVIMPADVEQADEIYLINSVRKWRRVRLAEGEPR
jgi:para-aminobenzoate synthetase/4-amino-4-deoxychorismate lyase